MVEKIIPFEGIGDVKFKRNKRSRAISISIRPIKGIIVNFPFFLPFSEAIRIVELRKNWIQKNLPRIKIIENKITQFNETSEFKTRSRVLNIAGHTGPKFTADLTENTINLRYPLDYNVTSPNIQKLIRTSIQWALKAEAKEYLPNRIRTISANHNLKFNKLFLKNNKTNWGSCSAINNINLNIHLVRLPDYLIDYVIIHELCHTVEKNHGPKFWEFMQKFIPNPKELSKELKSYSTQIY
ncbi:MAG: hypothetical protein A2W99_14120 [Bacteroidetes bacterium GWF2_33_16]|nr:MAG: hypothetical protein A2X00_06050 [Bacteroidetes bacterium GWE2_32_14]OFY04763.1 MAG: hypothetical protein A2W99_14120 [Bacteroidetes bacterium GWF2_33_16]